MINCWPPLGKLHRKLQRKSRVWLCSAQLVCLYPLHGKWSAQKRHCNAQISNHKLTPVETVPYQNNCILCGGKYSLKICKSRELKFPKNMVGSVGGSFTSRTLVHSMYPNKTQGSRHLVPLLVISS